MHSTMGFTASCFDLLHAGHVAMLAESKLVCDYLMVGLHVDPSRYNKAKNTPVQSLVERYIQLMSIEFVDQVVPYETEDDLMDILTSFPINLRIIGEDYRDKSFTGKSLDMEVYYNTRAHSFSTTELRQRVFMAESKLYK
jgi:glycerol-3-phosphate cytidylyltransferase